MALLVSFKNPHRQEEMLENAYLRVSDFFNVNEAIKEVEFSYKVYYSEADRDGDNPAKPIFDERVYISGIDYETYFAEEILREEGRSLKTQAYSYLKSLPLYEGCQDYQRPGDPEIPVEPENPE